MHYRFVFIRTENDRRITQTEDGGFLYLLQRAALLALKDMRVVDEDLCQFAEHQLRISAGNAEDPCDHAIAMPKDPFRLANEEKSMEDSLIVDSSWSPEKGNLNTGGDIK